jgi:hypothetical protein
MPDDYPPKILHVIPCINPGLSCCEHRLTGKKPADNVWRCEVYCGKWRENRMRDKVFRACQTEYGMQEPAVIDAELYQKNRFSLREDK